MTEQERAGREPATQNGDDVEAAEPHRLGRRRTAAGLAGATVLMTLSSRSAFGAAGMCGSETASAALSGNQEQPDCGCSPGFWWNTNGQRVWAEHIEPAYPEFSRGASFNQVFCSGLPPSAKSFFADNMTALMEARGSGGSYPATNYDSCHNVHAVGMHAVAALLNVVFYGDRYPAVPRFSSAQDVIDAFQGALTGLGNVCKNLTAFKDRVDVYSGLWCFNGKDWGD